MNKYTLVALSVAGGILSGLAWTGWCSGLILLVALVPFFIIENYLFENPGRFTSNAFFIYLLPGMFIFSIFGIGWIRIASLGGAICVITGLSFLMSFTLWLAHSVRLRAGNISGFVSLFTFWLGYEFISLNVSIVSPWLNLGNGLSKDIAFIQWYEVTGTAGGSIWILLSNLLFTLFIINSLKPGRMAGIYFTIWILAIVLPSAVSIARYLTIEQNTKDGEEVLIVQPNIDPYTEKFRIPFDEQLKKVIALAETEITDKTIWVITPETIVDDPVNLDELDSNKYIIKIKELTVRYPNATVVAGLVSYKLYPPSNEAPTISARRIDASGNYYDHFNSALKIDTGKTIEVYKKSRLVPGIEMQFSTGPGRLISRILPSLGGTPWGYGIQKERNCFTHQSAIKKIAPVICYESVFGEFVAEYVKNGANSLFIMTNDGWWKNSIGYNLHLSYASIRAIETRRQVVRAGNTGVSCIIDIRGKRIAETKWWTVDVLKWEIFPEVSITPYVMYGDFLLRLGTFLSVLIILIVFITLPFRKKISK